MSTNEQKLFPARLAMLPATAAFVQDFCDRHRIVRDDCMRLMLIVEELFTNSVEHGYRAENEGPIRVVLAVEGGAVALLYEDSAPRYDPLTSLTASPASLTDPVESRPTGGLGVYLVSQLVKRTTYAYEDGCNRMRLTMPLAD